MYFSDSSTKVPDTGQTTNIASVGLVGLDTTRTNKVSVRRDWRRLERVKNTRNMPIISPRASSNFNIKVSIIIDTSRNSSSKEENN